jgi:3,4-dihydroxy 2-butanone 4-phosphate synthase/GTP cyclohydrolase II
LTRLTARIPASSPSFVHGSDGECADVDALQTPQRLGVEHNGRVPRPPRRAARISSIPDAVADFAAGRFVVVVDDEGRENEGDLCVAAELVTPQHITFMARNASGLICTAMTGERLDQLRIGPVVAQNTSPFSTAFAVSVEAAHVTTTGISAYDRAMTVRQLVNPAATAGDFVRPGHTFPIRAAVGGVLARQGHTEATVDLARMAGVYPAGVMCEIMNDDGTMARADDLEAFAEQHGLRMISIKDLVAYRRCTENLVSESARCHVPVDGVKWEVRVYEELYSGEPYVAFILGDVVAREPVLVRPHSGCLTGDVFGSERCDCGEQLQMAMRQMATEGRGVVLYFGAHEGRGIGLVNKIRAYQLQEHGLDTVEANEALHQPVDRRDYSAGSSILQSLGIQRIRVLTNNPQKLRGLECHGVKVVERVPLHREPTEHNAGYLQTKRDKLGHLL